MNDCIARAQRVTPLSNHDVVGEVSVNTGTYAAHAPWEPWPQPPQAAAQKRLVLVDTGAKHNIAHFAHQPRRGGCMGAVRHFL